MPQEQFMSLDGENSVALHFLRSPDPEFYEWLAKLFEFKAQKIRALAETSSRQEPKP